MTQNTNGYGETVLEVDIAALQHNYQFLTSMLPKETLVMPVVKAFGYGSDAITIAQELEKLGAHSFAVAFVEEGVALRDGGITAPILVLHPQPSQFGTLIDRCLEPSLYSPRVLKAFIKTATEKKQKDYPVQININTGLNRLGFFETDISWISDTLATSQALKVNAIFSHLAASEDLSEKAFTMGQIESFKKSASSLQEKIGYNTLLHQSNTSTVINYPEAYFDMVRMGIGLYGYANDPKVDAQLKPVATLKSVISQIHRIEPGESVGYNRAYKANGYEKIATLPLGHADGISRHFGNGKGWVTIHGQKAPIVGNVCMDMIMVNITEIDCKEGDPVVVFGKEMSAATWAQANATISYEVLTAISQRVKRVFV